MFVTGKNCTKPKMDDLAKHEISPEIDITAEAPDGLHDCERSSEVGDYRPYADHVDARSAVCRQLRTLSYEEAFKIWTVKEQRPGFTGLVKRVDTIAETRVLVVET